MAPENSRPTSVLPTGRADDKASASEKTLLVLEAALRHPRFTDVVEATGLAKATTHRILATLVDRGFIVVTPDGTYQPGPQILALAGQALQRLDISAIAQPFVGDLVDRVHCTSHVGVANGDEIVYLVRMDSDKPYQMPSRVGHAIPMHSSGIGKVVLASYSDDDVERFVARAGLPRRTPDTITTIERLREELAQIRRDGYGFDWQENVPGVVCVAAPIRDHTGTTRYGLSISTLALEYTYVQLEALAPAVVETAARISAALGHRA
ncbi:MULTISPECIES: IclR family transcriptional regulator [unclassified Actinotalea]|uniref:IclR family transcriptional regulator n=1 Tax=unclassified Actinotalea TaxID=2638618 RepID=UPI0015F54B18|nr:MULTISPECIES: IclR family transcriptional regulator [unclassified Actinotalea]